MIRRFCIVPVLCAALCGLVFGNWCRADDRSASDQDAARDLAEYFSVLASQAVQKTKPPELALPQSIALWHAAVRLNPTERRFHRLLIDALLEAKDRAGAADALTAYYNLDQTNQYAQTQEVELHLASLQSINERLDYLNNLIGAEGISKEVRSYCAARSASLLIDKADSPGAIEMLHTAIALNPVNLSALRMEYDLVAPTGSPMERITMLMAMLRSNPGQAVAATRLALELADAGLIQESITWFNFANNVFQHTGLMPTVEFGRGASSELFIANHPDDALALATQYATAFPQDDQGWFIALAITHWELNRNKDDKATQDASAKVEHLAMLALTNRLAVARHSAGDAGATTRPMDSVDTPPFPDVSGDVDRLKRVSDPRLADEYIGALQALIWHQLYFRRSAVDVDPLLTTLGTLVSEQDVTLTRLRGWRRFVEGDNEGARQKFVAVADRDPYAALGLILIDASNAATHDRAVAQAKQLLAAHPSGEVGAVLTGALRSLGVEVEPVGSADALRTAIGTFPTAFLQILDQPQNFYSIRGIPVKVEYDFGEPILGTVNVQNISQYDLTIGPEGILRAELWFDAQLRGEQRDSIPGVAIERMTQRLVLHPGQSINVTLRLDNQQLYPLYSANPSVTIAVSYNVLTNPVGILADAAGHPSQGKPGLAGYRVAFSSIISRSPVVIGTPQARQAVFAALVNATPSQRMNLLSALGQYVSAVHDNAAPSGDMRALGDDLSAKIEHTITADAEPLVRAWAQTVSIGVAPPEKRADLAEALAHNSDWRVRMMVLTAAANLRDHGKSLETELLDDKDTSVKEYATALVRQAAASATQPSDASPVAPLLPPSPAPVSPTSSPSAPLPISPR